MIRAASRVAACLALVIIAWPPVAAAPAASRQSATELVLSLRLRNSGLTLLGRMINNCQLLEPAGWSLPETLTKYTFASTRGTPIGALDVGGRRGEVYVKSGGLQVEQLFVKGRPNVVRLADLGVALHGSNMYLTGRITRGQSQTTASRRVRLALARGAQFEAGPLVDSRNRPVPSTFSFIVSGKLRFLPALTRVFDRTRCKGVHNVASRPFPPGYELGFLTMGLRPDAAVGLEGSGQITPDIRDLDTDAPVKVEPAAGASRGSGGALVTPLAGRVPLACLAGASCVPGGGDVGLAGFDMLYNGRRASVANVVLSSTRTAPGKVEQTLSGTLDGTPVTIGAGPGSLGVPALLSLTDEFDQRASAALGASIVGSLKLEFLFTRTGPA